MTIKTRLARLRDRMTVEQVDAFAIVNVPNLGYCTGFPRAFDEEPAHIGFVTADQAVLLTDGRFIEALSSAAEGGPWRVELVTDSLSGALGRLVNTAEAGRVALETSLPYARFKDVSRALGADVAEATGWVEALRAVKDASELAAVSAAQELTDRTFDHVLGVLRTGLSEREIALELEFFMRREGSEGVAFPPIVASGPNSAFPHAKPGDRVLADGDFLTLDFGARIDGYCADMTRTVVIGGASARKRDLYEAVLAANLTGAAAARAGVLGKDVDAAARAEIVDRGFGEYFSHGLGHGVGIEVHEAPSVGPRSEAALPLGAVITIEPGIYIPGFGGARIEDLAVVEEGGVRILTSSTKDLIEL